MEQSIQDFKAITGCEDDEANHFLEASDGKMETAVELYFQQQQQNQPSSSAQHLNAVNGNDDDDIRAPLPRTSGVLVEESYRATYAPPIRVVRNSVFDHARDFKAEAENQRAQMERGGRNAETARKVQNLAAIFRPPTDIMFPGSWDEARRAAEAEGRWMLVNIQDVQEFPCQILNRDVWSHATVKDLITNNFIFWQVHNDSADGQRFCSYYKAKAFPTIAIIDPRTGELILSLKVKDAIHFCDQVTEFLDAHPSFQSLDAKFTTSVSITTRMHSSTNGSKHTYMSPKPFHQNGMKRPASPFGSGDEETPGPSSSKVSKLSSPNDVPLPVNEDWKQFVGKSGSDTIEIKLRFIFPNGTREVITVPSSTTIKALACYVKSRGFSSEEYELVLNYPKRVISLATTQHSNYLHQIRLGSQEVVHVERK